MMEKKPIDDLLLEYLDEEPLTWSRTEESIVLSKVGEIVDVLNVSVQPLRENGSLHDTGVKTHILNNIGDAKILLAKLNHLLIAMKHE